MHLMQAQGGPEGVDIMAQWLELEEPLRTREPAPQWKAFLELGLRPPYLWRFAPLLVRPRADRHA